MDICGSKHYATCYIQTTLAGVTTGDTDSGTGFESVGVEALVAACRRYLSTYARRIGVTLHEVVRCITIDEPLQHI